MRQPVYPAQPHDAIPAATLSPRQVTSVRPGLLLPVIGLLTLVLSGCGSSNDPKAPTKENFASAIKAWQAANPQRNTLCQDIDIGLSQNDEEDNVISSLYMPKNGDWYAQLDGLRKLGYLTLTDTTDILNIPSTRVGITPKYLKVFGPLGDNKTKTVCLGRRSLDHIDDFTAPSELAGFKISQVEATDKITVTADAAWAKDVTLAKLVHYVPLPATQKTVYTMVLKDSGWAVDSMR